MIFLSPSLPTHPMSPSRAGRPTPKRLHPDADQFQVRFGQTAQANELDAQVQAWLNRYQPAWEQASLAYSQANWAGTCQGPEYRAQPNDPTNADRFNAASAAYYSAINNPAAVKEAAVFADRLSEIQDPVLHRAATLLSQVFQQGTLEPGLRKEIDEKQTQLSGAHRSLTFQLEGKNVPRSALMHKLETIEDPDRAKQLWQQAHNYGTVTVGEDKIPLAEGLLELVRMQNRLAQDCGYSNFFEMKLRLNEVEPEQLRRVMDEVTQATEPLMSQLRQKLNTVARDRFPDIYEEDATLPWLNEGNDKHLLSFDPITYLQGKDPLKALRKTAAAMGFEVEMARILQASTYDRHGETRSSLEFDPDKDSGKPQNYFAFSMNPPGDVRLFGSLNPTAPVDSAFRSLLHESGHGLDSASLDANLPFILRDRHSITTESHAMLMESLLRNRQWLTEILGLPAEQAQTIETQAKPYYALKALTAIRHYMAVIEFERSLYENPEESVSFFNNQWWALREKYLGLQRPKAEQDWNQPYWLYIPHFITHPVYYPNYFLAELLRAQLLDKINQDFGSLLRPEAGNFLRSHWHTGELVPWTKKVEAMTDKPLQAQALQAELQEALQFLSPGPQDA